jgi:tetratricopeptide (TPR) repeat protein
MLVARIIRERDRANENAGKTSLALTESRQNERYSNQNFALLKGILESADPEKFTGGEITVQQLLDKATASLDSSPPEQEITEASVREILGSVYRKFGSYDKARVHLARALAIRESIAGRGKGGPDDAIAECLHNLAATLWWEGKYDEAEPNYVRALDMRRALHPGDHKDVATSMTHLAALRLRQGNTGEAKRLYTDVLGMRRRLFGAEHEEVAQSINNLAKIPMDAGEYEEAELMFRQALDMIIRLKGEKDRGVAAATQNLAVCLLEKGDARGAKESFERALSIRRSIYKLDHHLVASSLIGIAQADLALGTPGDAEKFARESLAMYEKLGRSEHTDYADALVVLSAAARSTTGPEEALRSLTRAIAIFEKAKPPATMRVGEARIASAACLLELRRVDEAQAQFAQGVSAIRSERGDRSRVARDAVSKLAAFYRTIDKPDLAAPLEALGSESSK